MPIQGQIKTEVKMEIKIKTLKFDADQKLIEYVEKKVYDNAHPRANKNGGKNGDQD